MSVLICTVLPGKRPGYLYLPRQWKERVFYTIDPIESIPAETGLFFRGGRIVWRSVDKSLYFIEKAYPRLQIEEGTGIWLNSYNEGVTAVPTTEFEIKFYETFQ